MSDLASEELVLGITSVAGLFVLKPRPRSLISANSLGTRALVSKIGREIVKKRLQGLGYIE